MRNGGREGRGRVCSFQGLAADCLAAGRRKRGRGPAPGTAASLETQRPLGARLPGEVGSSPPFRTTQRVPSRLRKGGLEAGETPWLCRENATEEGAFAAHKARRGPRAGSRGQLETQRADFDASEASSRPRDRVSDGVAARALEEGDFSSKLRKGGLEPLFVGATSRSRSPGGRGRRRLEAAPTARGQGVRGSSSRRGHPAGELERWSLSRRPSNASVRPHPLIPSSPLATGLFEGPFPTPLFPYSPTHDQRPPYGAK
jgi:hypothetical protein